MNKKWKILISFFFIGILLIYVIGQSIFLKKPSSHEFPLSQVWKNRLNSTVVGLSMAGENTLLVRTNASIAALDTTSGKVLWQHALSRQPDPKPAIANGANIYVTDGKGLFALDQEDGAVLWRQKLPNADSWVTDVSDSKVIVNLPGYEIYVFDAITGDVLWHKPVCRGHVKAFVSEPNIIVPCGGIIGLYSSTGELAWEGTNNGTIGQTDFGDGILYYYIDYSYAFDSRSQQDLWKTTVVHNGIENFKVLRDKVFYRDADRLCMLQRENGHLEWCEKFPIPQTPAILEDTVYSFNGNHKRIRAMNVGNGDLRGALDLSNLNYFSIDRDILTSNDAYLFFSNGKDVYAYGN
jgi:hypothetical protein